MKCKACKQEKELRFQTCFDCADAESIIATGVDMYHRGIDGKEKPAKTALQKVELLIQKGWVYKGSRG